MHRPLKFEQVQPSQRAEAILKMEYDKLSKPVQSVVDRMIKDVQQQYRKLGYRNIEEFKARVKQDLKEKKVSVKDIKAIHDLLLRVHEINKTGETTEAEPRIKLEKLVAERCQELGKLFTDRYAQFGKENPPIIRPEHIVLPEGLTMEHLEVINEIFPGAFEPRILPTLEDLNGLDEEYFSVMYPITQHPDDTIRGLVSFREERLWEKDCLLSMRTELSSIGGSLVLLDTAIKPSSFTGDPVDKSRKYYGTKKGNDPSADPLQPLFQEIFGPISSRFYHSWNELQALLPKLEERIKDGSLDRHLLTPHFKIQLVPATLDNQHMTFFQPESSSTFSSEWTSTFFLSEDGSDTVGALTSGDAHRGGSALALRYPLWDRRPFTGARFAIVFRKFNP